MKVKIDTNVPAPAKPGKACKWPFRELGVGDSFLMPDYEPSTAASLASYHAKRTGWKFRTATVGTDVRVWRTA